MSNAFGETLRRMREAGGFSQGDLARHLGVSVPYISDVERGRRAPLMPARAWQAADYLLGDPRELAHLAMTCATGRAVQAWGQVACGFAMWVGMVEMRGAYLDGYADGVRNLADGVWGKREVAS